MLLRQKRPRDARRDFERAREIISRQETSCRRHPDHDLVAEAEWGLAWARFQEAGAEAVDVKALRAVLTTELDPSLWLQIEGDLESIVAEQKDLARSSNSNRRGRWRNCTRSLPEFDLMKLIERIQLRQKFGEEAYQWEGMDSDQLCARLVDYEEKAGGAIGRRLCRSALTVIFMISVLVFWMLALYIAWLPAQKVVQVLPEFPSLAVVLGSVTFTVMLLFMLWGVSAEDAKLGKLLVRPLDRFEAYIKERENSHQKAEALRKLVDSR